MSCSCQYAPQLLLWFKTYRYRSWKTAFVGLTTLAPDARNDSILERFLSDPQTTSLLSRPLNAFSKPTAQTKSNFETRTAAIHLTPSSDARYDPQQLKQDALWLSEAAKIDEVSALRLAVIEWQSRSEAQLLSGFSEEESASVQGVTGAPANGLSTFLPKTSLLSSISTTPNGAFQSKPSRRLRLIGLYFSERRHLVKTTEILVRAGLANNSIANEQGKGKDKAVSSWIDRIGKTILNARSSGDDSVAGFEPLLLESLEALRDRINGLVSGSGVSIDDQEDADVELDFGKCLLLEMTHILQLVFSIIDCAKGIISSSVLLAWLRFAAEYGFFDNFEFVRQPQRIRVFFRKLTVLQQLEALQVFVPPIQSLVSIISLTVLKLPLIIEIILNYTEHTALPPPDQHTPFILDPSGLKEVHPIIMGLARDNSLVASPLVFAWGIILQTLRDMVLSRRESREIRQSQHAVDGFADTDTSYARERSASPTDHRSSRPPQSRSSSSDGDPEPTVFDEILLIVADASSDEDPIQYLAKCAVIDSHVFDVVTSLASRFCGLSASEGPRASGLRMKIILLDLVRFSLEWVQYSPEVLTTCLALLTGDESFWSIVERPKIPHHLDVAAMFLDDDRLLLPKLLGVASARFPFETMPFLKLVKALGTCLKYAEDGKLYATAAVEKMGVFTQALPEGFRDYDTIREEENTNSVTLRSDIKLFTKQETRTSYTNGSTNQLIARASGDSDASIIEKIPAGTEGRVVSESSPVIIIQWIYQFSGLRYLGKLLESALSSSDLVDNVSKTKPDKEVVAEIIGLLALLLASSTNLADQGHSVGETNDMAHKLLDEASADIGRRSGDIITVILDLFESEIQEPQNSWATDGSMDVLISCAQFLFALTPVYPGRVWPFLARSGLLEMNERGGKLAEILAGAEIVTGRFEFTISCIRVFQELLNDATVHAVARKSTNKAVTRFQKADNLGTGIPSQVMSKVVLAFVRALMDIFESYTSWRYLILDEKLEIGARILMLFDTILAYNQGIDDSTDAKQMIVGMMGPAASYLIETFLSSSSNTIPIAPLLEIFSDGIKTPYSTLFFGTTRLWVRRTISALKFCTTLIRVATLQGRSDTRLEIQLFKVSPLLVRIYCVRGSYRLPVVTLLEVMIISAASADGEPLSLLGHLGSETAKEFLNLLSHSSQPLEDERLDVGIWKLLSAIVSNRQQWLAIYLLTGNAPRESLRVSTNGAVNGSAPGKHLLARALDGLVKINETPCSVALAELEFVAMAGDYWPWSISLVHKNQALLTSLLDYLGNLQARIDVMDHLKSKGTCDALQMTSLILEVLAIYMHHARQLGDTSFAKRLLPKITYLADTAVTVQGYNSSLHTNLKKNFEARFSGCSLSSFKRTKLQTPEFGPEFFYDMDVAKKMLGYDSSWLGARGSGLAEEFERANSNLSIVEAQVVSANS